MRRPDFTGIPTFCPFFGVIVPGGAVRGLEDRMALPLPAVVPMPKIPWGVVERLDYARHSRFGSRGTARIIMFLFPGSFSISNIPSFLFHSFLVTCAVEIAAPGQAFEILRANI